MVEEQALTPTELLVEADPGLREECGDVDQLAHVVAQRLEGADEALGCLADELADHPAVPGAEPERGCEEQAHAAAAERPHGREHRAQHEDRADRRQRGRHAVGHVAAELGRRIEDSRGEQAGC